MDNNYISSVIEKCNTDEKRFEELEAEVKELSKNIAILGYRMGQLLGVIERFILEAN